MSDPQLRAVERAYRGFYEGEPARASVSFLGVQPIEVLRFQLPDGGTSYATLGMSRQAMNSDQFVTDGTGPRAEVLASVRGEGGDLWRQLAVLAASPVVDGLVLAAGARVDLATPVASGSRCTGFVVGRAELPPLLYDKITIDFLEVTPATPNELAWSRIHGTDALVRRWREHDVDLADLGRAEVPLS